MPKKSMSHSTRDRHSGGPEYLLSREVASLARFTSVDGGLAFLRKAGLEPIVRGRAFLWRRDEVDALLAGRQEVRS